MSEMADLQDEYESHPAWAELDEAIQEFDSIDPSSEELERRIHQALLRLRAVAERRTSPSIFVSPRMLNAFHNGIQNSIKAPLDRERSAPGRGHLDTALDGVSQVLDIVIGWPPTKDTFGRGVLAALKESERIGDQRLKDLMLAVEQAELALSEQQRSFLSQFEKKEEELSNFIQEARDEATSIITTTQTDTNSILQDLTTDVEATKRVVDTFEPTVARQTARIDDAVNSSSLRFKSSEEDWEKRFASLVRRSETSHRKAQEAFQVEFDEVLKGYSSETEGLLAALKVSEQEVSKMVLAAAKKLTSTDYGEFSRRQKIQADILFTLAILVFIAAGVGVGLLYWHDGGWGDNPTRSLLIKSSLSLPLIIAGWILVNESRQIRSAATAAKDMQLRLVAFEPFISNMLDEKQHELREEVVRSLFVAGGPSIHSQSRRKE